jgi:hypothetical protein
MYVLPESNLLNIHGASLLADAAGAVLCKFRLQQMG